MVWISFDEHVFHHPWEKVVEAALRKYPNPETPNVISTDILDRNVDCQGRLCSQRVIASYWRNMATDIVRGLTGIDLTKTIHALELSVLDPKEKKYELTSRNYNFLNYISIDERLTYAPHKTDPNATLLKQEWQISVQNLGFQSYLEHLMGSAMKSNTSKGRAGIEFVIGQIKEEVERLANPVVEEMQNLAASTMKEFNNVQLKLEEAQKMLQESSIQEIGQIREEVERLANPVVEEMQNLAASTIKEFNNVHSKLEEAQKMLQETSLQEELSDFISKTTPQTELNEELSS